jgi:aspartate aminotransferase-like enzyme
MTKDLLMIPGPVEISEDVLAAYNGQTVAHYGADWAKLYLDTEQRVCRLFGCDGRSFLMPGSGSLGLDTMATTFCADKKCLVLGNGMFGDRLKSVVETHTGDLEFIRFPLDQPVDVETVEKKIKAEKFDVVCTVQVETSTGLLNPVQELARVVKQEGCLFVVDAISSAAIELLDMDGWGIDVIVTASQKGFETPPGLGIVAVRKHLINHIENKQAKSWYTDLRIWCDYYNEWHDWHPFPVTLPTNNVRALARSLDFIEDEGMEQRHGNFLDTSRRVRRAFSALGLEPLAKESVAAHGLTALSTKGRFEPVKLIAFLEEHTGIRIAGSFGDLKSHVFRVGHMSRKQCLTVNLAALISSTGLFMKHMGLQPDVNRALSDLFVL